MSIPKSMKSKKIISIILARKNSKGIKNKNLKIINGKPLLYWSIQSSIGSKLNNKTYVSSDSKKILNYSKKNGADIIVRPNKYAKDDTTSEETILHAVDYLENKKIIFDTIVFIQPTSPMKKK